MVEELREKLPQIEKLCKAFGVERLDVVGSAARGDFDPARSDFDFFAKFGGAAEISLAHQYFGFIEELQNLFGRPVHVAEDFPGQDPKFVARIQPDRKLLYAA